MEKLNKETLETTFKSIRKKLYIEIDQNILIKEITRLSDEINGLKNEKEYNDTAKKLIDLITMEYSRSISNSAGGFPLLKTLGILKNNLENSSLEIIRQIIIKSEKLENQKLLLDFLNFDNFQEIMDRRTQKK